MATKKSRKGISRREFVGGSALAGGAIASMGLLSGCTSSTSKALKWDHEADVVVVGYGGAGAAAAITANEQGGRVIILEKAPEAGGNTAASAGGVRLPSDAGKIAQFLESTSFGAIDSQTAKVFAETWLGLEDWFTSHGAQFTVTKAPGRWIGAFPGAEALDKTMSMNRSDEWRGVGKDLFAFLASVVEKRKGIEVMLQTPAQRLVQDPATKAILGVTAIKGGQNFNVKANKAVIMALGGFEANRRMIATYIEEAPVPIAVSGTPYNTGDGIRMVIDAGADLWHMNGIEWARSGFKPAALPAAFWLDPKSHAWIDVNKLGMRFHDEGQTYGHAKKHLEVFRFDDEKGVWPNHPWYMIFDEKTRKAGPAIMVNRTAGAAPFVTYNLTRGLHSWSTDNQQEIEKGWIKTGNTLAELASKIGVDSTGLQQTVARYNASCKKNMDEQFGRKPDWLVAIDQPPFYALECAVNMINTQGGPRRNPNSQVLSPYGTVIPGLYAVGEFGSVFGFLYPGGCNLPECIVTGIIAGRSALSEGGA